MLYELVASALLIVIVIAWSMRPKPAARPASLNVQQTTAAAAAPAAAPTPTRRDAPAPAVVAAPSPVVAAKAAPPPSPSPSAVTVPASVPVLTAPSSRASDAAAGAGAGGSGVVVVDSQSVSEPAAGDGDVATPAVTFEPYANHIFVFVDPSNTAAGAWGEVLTVVDDVCRYGCMETELTGPRSQRRRFPTHVWLCLSSLWCASEAYPDRHSVKVTPCLPSASFGQPGQLLVFPDCVMYGAMPVDELRAALTSHLIDMDVSRRCVGLVGNFIFVGATQRSSPLSAQVRSCALGIHR